MLCRPRRPLAVLVICDIVRAEASSWGRRAEQLYPGDALYFPSKWWHATFNLDQTVFISTFVNYPFTRSYKPPPANTAPKGGVPTGKDEGDEEGRDKKA